VVRIEGDRGMRKNPGMSLQTRMKQNRILRRVQRRLKWSMTEPRAEAHKMMLK
jgi:hypothetical protein